MLCKYFIATDIRAGKKKKRTCCPTAALLLVPLDVTPFYLVGKVDFYPPLSIISTIQIIEFKPSVRKV